MINTCEHDNEAAEERSNKTYKKRSQREITLCPCPREAKSRTAASLGLVDGASKEQSVDESDNVNDHEDDRDRIKEGDSRPLEIRALGDQEIGIRSEEDQLHQREDKHHNHDHCELDNVSMIGRWDRSAGSSYVEA